MSKKQRLKRLTDYACRTEVRTARDEMTWEFTYKSGKLAFIADLERDADGERYLPTPTLEALSTIMDALRTHPKVIACGGAVGGTYTIVPGQDAEIEFWPIDQLH
jgi:hypothetical protein